jgi:hypothetical protein
MNTAREIKKEVNQFNSTVSLDFQNYNRKKHQNSFKSFKSSPKNAVATLDSSIDVDVNLASNYLFLQQSLGEGMIFASDPSVTCLPRQLNSQRNFHHTKDWFRSQYEEKVK